MQENKRKCFFSKHAVEKTARWDNYRCLKFTNSCTNLKKILIHGLYEQNGQSYWTVVQAACTSGTLASHGVRQVCHRVSDRCVRPTGVTVPSHLTPFCHWRAITMRCRPVATVTLPLYLMLTAFDTCGAAFAPACAVELWQRSTDRFLDFGRWRIKCHPLSQAQNHIVTKNNYN